MYEEERDLFEDVEEETEEQIEQEQDVVEDVEKDEGEKPSEVKGKDRWRDNYFKEKKAREGLEGQLAKFKQALKEYADSDDAEEVLLQKKANETGQTVEEIKAEREKYIEEGIKKGKELARTEWEKEQESKAVFTRDLAAIKEKYPDVVAKEVSDLGSDFIKLMQTGVVSAVEAYELTHKVETKPTKKTASTGSTESVGGGVKDFFTSEEVDNMSREEIRKNFDVIERSMTKW